MESRYRWIQGVSFFFPKKKGKLPKSEKRKKITKPASMEQQQQQLYSLYTGVGQFAPKTVGKVVMAGQDKKMNNLIIY